MAEGQVNPFKVNATRDDLGVEALETHNGTKSGGVRGTTTAAPEPHRGSSATSFAAEKDTNPVDQAALMGAALAAIVALVVSPGEFGNLSSIIGATLLCVILAFYRLELRLEHFLRAIFRGAAPAAVTGLCACLLISWPVQIWVDHQTSAMNYCSGSTGDAYSNCLGNRAFQPLALFWAVFTVLGTSAYFGGWWRWKRKRLRGYKSNEPVPPAERIGKGCSVQTTRDHCAEDVIAAVRRCSDHSERTRRLLIGAAVIDGALRAAALIDIKRRPAGESRSRK
jgi:hypothetical protein